VAQRNVGFEVIVGRGLRVGRRQGNEWEAVLHVLQVMKMR
jgi:hypothetical protein